MDLTPLHFEHPASPIQADGGELPGLRDERATLGAAAACAWVARAGERTA